MKLVKILLSQAARLGRISGKEGGNIYGLNLARLCVERYGFLEAPRTVAEYDLSKGVTFLHGYFQERFVIDKFQVFDNGILAEAKIDTDACDEFLSDVIGWATTNGGFTFEPDPNAPRIYLSNIETQSNISLAKAFQQVASVGREIANIMRGYGHVTPDWELSGLSFGSGTTTDAAQFKFERREGAPPSDEIFFASARMRTKDHLTILESLERTVS